LQEGCHPVLVPQTGSVLLRNLQEQPKTCTLADENA
jgi:hypothetical protein